jgi:hypothetical protein
MPKRLLITLAVAAIVIAACKGGGSTSSPPTNTPISPSPNPSIHTATIQVTVAGTPVPKIPVEISTPKNPESPRPGQPFFTKNSGKKGFARFPNLKVSKTYCWVATISPSFRASECAGWEIWQTSTILLGN